MPRCKNIPEGEKLQYYTGKEKNPRGRGHLAKYCEGKSKKGTDGEMYMAKNGRWVKKTSKKRKTSPRLEFDMEYPHLSMLYERLTDLIKNIENKLEQKGLKYSQKSIQRLRTFDKERLENIILILDNYEQAGINYTTLREILEDQDRDGLIYFDFASDYDEEEHFGHPGYYYDDEDSIWL